MCTLDRRAEQFHHCEMGTTMVMASIANNVATIAHVGDSRCYVIRQSSVENGEKYEKLYQTKDHVRTAFGWEVVSRCFFLTSSLRTPRNINLTIFLGKNAKNRAFLV